MRIALALLATFASATALNVGYLLEHRAVHMLPPLSARTPLRSARLLLATRRWLLGFSIEATGWALFVIALALAPLSLVQAAAAGGIGILALLSVRFTGVPLSATERIGVAVAVAGLALLGISLAGGHGEGAGAAAAVVAAWIGVSVAVAVTSVQLLARRLGAGVAYGLATGVLFAAGDVATKGAVEARGDLVFVAALIACYGAGTLVLQSGFQRGSPLATAGIATLLTNALPIVAGMTIFAEPLPEGPLGAVRIAAFVAVVAGGVLLGERKHGRRTHAPDADAVPAQRSTGAPRDARHRAAASRARCSTT